jgi:hypothetical protein
LRKAPSKLVEEHSSRKIVARRSSLLAGVGEGNDIHEELTAAAGPYVKPEDSEDAASQRCQGSFSWLVGDVARPTRRDFLMLNAGLLGAIAAGAEASSPPPDLPFFGQYYGAGTWGAWSAANFRLRIASPEGTHFFFYADRTGTIDRIHMHWRTYLEGYAGGDGGTYSIEIRQADPVTKEPITTGSAICSVSGISPGSTVGNTWKNLTHTFTTTGQLIAKQPYALVFRNTHSSPTTNFVSLNIGLHTWEVDGEKPSGTDPADVGSSVVAVSGWSPVIIDGAIEWYPWPALGDAVTPIDTRFIGGLYAMLRYSDGQWVGWGAFGGGQGNHLTISSAEHVRERFRVTRQSRTVSGVFVRVTRKNAATGNLLVTLESGPASDTSGNGTQIEQVTVGASDLFNVGSFESLHGDQAPPVDYVPYVWVPFLSNHTLSEGTIYNLRLSKSGGSGEFDIWCSGRSDSFMDVMGSSGRSLTWDQWEAQREIEWSAWEDSRGVMVSTNSGSTWSFPVAQLSPILFKCA